MSAPRRLERPALAMVNQGLHATIVRTPARRATFHLDLFLQRVRTVPFTFLRTSAVSDLPLMVLRYVVLFPLYAGLTVHFEAGMELDVAHLVGTVFFFWAAHLLLRYWQARSLAQFSRDFDGGDGEEFLQSLGLRKS